jgi:hypothetical protein
VVRKVEVDQLVGATEIGQRLGMRHSTHVHQLRRSDPTFPEPLTQLSPGPGGAYVWYWPDVESWARQTGRLPSSQQPRSWSDASEAPS